MVAGIEPIITIVREHDFFLMKFPIYLNFKQIVAINFGWLTGPGEDSRASFQNFLEKKRLPRRFFPLIG